MDFKKKWPLKILCQIPSELDQKKVSSVFMVRTRPKNSELCFFGFLFILNDRVLVEQRKTDTKKIQILNNPYVVKY